MRVKATLALCLLAAALCSCARASSTPVVSVAGGDAGRGKAVIQKYGCSACHMIPGVPGPETSVGPSLAGVANRVFIAGVTPNVPDAMIKWLKDPPSVDTLTAMPMLGLSDAEARDAAAYLYSLR